MERLSTVRDGARRTSQGDLLGAPNKWVWSELDKHLVRAADFAKLSTEQCYVVYVTNVSSAQVTAMNVALRESTEASYAGVSDLLCKRLVRPRGSRWTSCQKRTLELSV